MCVLSTAGVLGAVLHLAEGVLGAVLHIADGQDMTERGRGKGKMVTETGLTAAPELGEIRRGGGGRKESGRKPEGERAGERVEGGRRAGWRREGGRKGGGRREGGRTAGGRRTGGRIAGGVEGTYTVDLSINDGIVNLPCPLPPFDCAADELIPYSKDSCVTIAYISAVVIQMFEWHVLLQCTFSIEHVVLEIWVVIPINRTKLTTCVGGSEQQLPVS